MTHLPANAHEMTTTSGIPRDTPTVVTMGSSMIAATVCDTNVDTIVAKNSSVSREHQGEAVGRAIY